MLFRDVMAPPSPASAAPSFERVGLSWLITVRWTMLLAGAGAVMAGRNALGLEASAPFGTAALALVACGATNAWLTWRVRRGDEAALTTLAGLLVSADVLLLSWLLIRSGGVLNPASVFYLVQIVVAALVLGRKWTWIVTSLAVAGYAMLFLAPTDDLKSAQVMHPEIGVHMQGMWIAFALTALAIAALVTRLVIAVERRDSALESMRDRNARTARVASLATLAAGAAHELSTPLSTIAVAARELERALADREDQALGKDARLIRSETDRCRAILDAMAGESGDPSGEAPRERPIGEIMDAVRAKCAGAEWARIAIASPAGLRVTWPAGAIARALRNLLSNALQASPDQAPISIDITHDSGRVRIVVSDRGTGMNPGELARAGEPFFTTKPAGRGTGLGLFVTRSTAEQLGGSLTLASSPGTGTTATMDLPIDVTTATSHGA